MENFRNRSVNQGSLARGFMAVDMDSMPVISTAKPSIMVPTPFLRSERCIYKSTPIKARMGQKFTGLHSCSQKLSP